MYMKLVNLVILTHATPSVFSIQNQTYSDCDWLITADHDNSWRILIPAQKVVIKIVT